MGSLKCMVHTSSINYLVNAILNNEGQCKIIIIQSSELVLTNLPDQCSKSCFNQFYRTQTHSKGNDAYFITMTKYYV